MLLIACVLISMQCLNAVESDLQIRGQLDIFKVDRNDLFAFVERQVDFSVAMVGLERTRLDVEENMASPKQGGADGGPPALAG